MKNRKIETAVIAMLLVLQTIIYFFFCGKKEYLHMDEAYSFGLTNYDTVQIHDAENFYDTWHNADYYKDYLVVDPDESGDFSYVYENQRNDVHPPFYYLLLRIAMEFHVGKFSFWSGLILNIIFSLVATPLTYLILRELLSDRVAGREIAAAIAFFSAVTAAAVSNVLYIRMYMLVGLFILITAYLHLKLFNDESLKPSRLAAIGITALVGSLTHYYFIFYLAAMLLLTSFRYLRSKNYKALCSYILAIMLAGILSLLIFPHSLAHVFGGHRGTDAMSNLGNSAELSNRIFEYLSELNYYGFNLMFFAVLATIVLLQVYIFRKNSSLLTANHPKGRFSVVCVPAIVYFLTVSIASPWVELRYILPVAGLLFSAAMCYLYRLLGIAFGEKIGNIGIFVFLLAVSLSPMHYGIEPQFTYEDNREIVERAENDLNLPTVYFYNSSNVRFMDDILLFSELDESYIARDVRCTDENVSAIFNGKDISEGVLIIINDGQDKDLVLNTVKSALGFTNAEHIKRMTACDVYFCNNQAVGE